MATTSSNKRQRTGQEDALLLSDLPDGILSHAASFLASPQKALFGLSMTASSESWTNNNFSIVREHQQSTAAILKSDKWKLLDFEVIEKNLAVKLTDDDLHAVLKCISAQDVLKKLNLTGCINITGRALEPLRGSAVIEHIDLSLVKQYELPKLDPEPMISETDIIPVLDSIVSKDSLKLIVFPKKWRTAKTTELAEFLVRYNQLLDRRVPKCTKCEVRFEVDTREWDMAVSDINDSNLFGKQSP